MTEETNNTLNEEADALRAEVNEVGVAVNNFKSMDKTDILDYVYYLRMIWADFQLYIIEPVIDVIEPTVIIAPKELENGEMESVFNIHDEGFRLGTSRGDEGLALGHSLLKYYNTIEKMVALLVDRMKTGGIAHETEVRVAFYGHELGQRKAFESILNLEHNVLVTNFDAGEWADRLMDTVLTLADRGFGLPPASPRKSYPGPLNSVQSEYNNK